MALTEPRITVIGGGTGSFTLLSELKAHTCKLSAVVNMADDGGSTGVLRDEFGVLPPGDIRQCLVALSNAPIELREVFNFRFSSGTFKGHTLGNIFLSGIETMSSDFNHAVKIAGDILNIQGRVLPSTLDKTNLVLDFNGQKVVGETNIGEILMTIGDNPKLKLEPIAKINPEALSAINKSDLIVIAPGDLYRSLAPTLLVDGLGEALINSQSPVVYVCNLVNKPNHTSGFEVHDYANEIERFAGGEILDCVLFNVDKPAKSSLDLYALDGEYPVGINQKLLEQASYQAIGGKFLSHKNHQRLGHDPIKRSLIRHDSQSVTSALLKLIK